VAKLLFDFENYQAERDAIGTMLIAYGEIEFGLLNCVGVALGGDLDTAARILFRARGEAARIEIADAIVRPAFAKVNLDGKWSNAHGAAKFCKKIRNQYAHCHWISNDTQGVLTFMDLDQDSKQPEGPIKLTRKVVNAELVASQQRYFEYCLDLFLFLEPEYRKRAGMKLVSEFDEPTSIPVPLLSIPNK
jgi:hypothetical protein